MYSISDEEQGINEAYRYPAILGYLVKKLGNSKRQIGKTKIQKLVYLLTRQRIVNFDYSMHYYGPYSPEVSDQLSLAESAEIIQSRWSENKGFFLKAGRKEADYQHLLSENEMSEIDKIVSRYGTFDTKGLTIITTYLFLKDTRNLTEDALVNELQKIKKYRTQEIRQVLEQAKILEKAKIIT
jgi:uncharacterized protein